MGLLKSLSEMETAGTGLPSLTELHGAALCPVQPRPLCSGLMTSEGGAGV